MATSTDSKVPESTLQLCSVEGGKDLLREYTGLLESEIESHVECIKEKGLHVAPYPCIRGYRFLDLVLSTTDVYCKVLSRVKNGAKFLDLACCLGQEVRKLVYDGVPSANTYGSDLYGGFFPVGYELFGDRDRLQTTFIAADIFDDESLLVKQLAGTRGADVPGESSRGGAAAAKKHFNHNADSWKELWARVGQRTGSEWAVEAELVPKFKFAPASSEL